MPIVRLLATCIDRGNPTNDKIVLLCGIDESGRLKDGEWFGAWRREENLYPFVLSHVNHSWVFEYGWNELSNRTNLNTHVLRGGEYFTVASSPESNEEPWEYAFKITHLTIQSS
jgi:hypothetical protein